MVAFFRAKLRMPTTTSTDLIRAAHDRAFIVAGVRDDDLLTDLQNAVDDAIAKGVPFEGWTDKQGVYRPGFRDRFREIVKQHGWDHKMSEGRRARMIYETNLRMARAAGRVRHGRDPAVMKAFPFWQYRHGATRTPLHPREQHLRWDGLILPADDPFWDAHTPPNGYLCSCDFLFISRGKLKRLRPKAPEPDESPAPLTKPVIDPRTGQLVEMPQGITFGFDYQPGRSTLLPFPVVEASDWQSDFRQLTLPMFNQPSALKGGRSHSAKPLAADVGEEDAITAFFETLGAAGPEGGLIRDATGHALIIDRSFFATPAGASKLTSSFRRTMLPLLAEALKDPDEIWVDWEFNRATGKWMLVRRYLRASPDGATISIMRFAKGMWSGVSSHPKAGGKKNKPRPLALEQNRHGFLVYQHDGKEGEQ